MKLVYEFNTDPATGQPAAITQSELEAAVIAFKAANNVNSPRLHLKTGPRSGAYLYGFATWGHDELGDALEALFVAIFSSQLGLEGYIPPVQDPLFTFDATGADLSGAGHIFAAEKDFMNIYAVTDAGWLGPVLNMGTLKSTDGISNTYVDGATNTVGYPNTYIQLVNVAGSGQAIAIASGEMEISGDGVDTAVTLNNAINILEPASGTSRDHYFVTADGKAHLAYRNVAGVVEVAFRSFQEATTLDP